MKYRVSNLALLVVGLILLGTTVGMGQHTVDPACISDVCEAIYDTLVHVDAEGNLIPGLASAWEIVDDGDGIILHLREEVWFHNGEYLTSEIVMDNFYGGAYLLLDFWREPLVGSALIGDAYPIDEYTVGIRTGELCAFQILSRLAGPAGMMIAREGLERQMYEPAYDPIGSGPYVVRELDPMYIAVLEQFPEYWRRFPRPEFIEIYVIPDESSRYLGLMNWDFDVMIGFNDALYADLVCATDFDVYGRPSEYQAVRTAIWRWPYGGDRRLRLQEVEYEGVLRVAVDSLLVCDLEDPRILLHNAAGVETDEFLLLDAVYGAFSRLFPDTDYEIRVLRNEDEVLYTLDTKTGTDGLIPSIPLIWDLGVEYGEGRAGELNVEAPAIYTYTCELLRSGMLLAAEEFSIKQLRDSPPILYSSDQWGNPKNGFDVNEDVYVSGINFPAGISVRLHPVPAQYSWSVADALDSVIGGWALAYASSSRSFTELVWYADHSVPGIYDIVGEWVAQDGYFSIMDAIDGRYGVGFTVIGTGTPVSYHAAGGGGSASHVEIEVVCKQPPLKSNGSVAGMPNPAYKNYYALAEPIWAAVNPYAGGGNYAKKTARIYVLKDKTSWNDGDSLADVSGGYETITIQPGCANVNYHRIWPKASGGYYDVIVDFAPFGVYDEGTDIIDHVAVQGFIVPDPSIKLVEIRFNRTTANAVDDALSVRRDKSAAGDIVAPEWKAGKPNLPAAYTASNGVDIQVTFMAASWVQSAQISAVTATGNLNSLPYQTVNFNGTGTATVLFHFTTPAAVDRFLQTWEWWYRNVDGTTTVPENFATSANRIYIVLSEPTLPWTTSGVTKVWTKVLDWSCEWAKGQTTYTGAATQVAQHLWDTTVTNGQYVTWSQYAYGKDGEFRLTNFLNNMPVIGLVNCYDMSKSCVTFGSALGCDLRHHFTSPWGSMNCILPTGRTWNCTQWFSNHAFGIMGTMIFDACMAVDVDTTPTSAPPAIFRWLINIDWTTYQSLVMLSGYTPGTPKHYNYPIK